MKKTTKLTNAFILISLSLMALSFGVVVAEEDEDFLAPDKAFALSKVELISSEKDGQQLSIRWDIADKYYMYKDKISFYSDDKKVEVGKWELPKGEIKNDEFFGRIEVYKHELVATVPVSSEYSSQEVKIIAKSQGCAEAGICYPPLRQDVTFTLPKSVAKETIATETTAKVQAKEAPEKALKENFLSSLIEESSNEDAINDEEEDEFLPAEKAFQLSVEKNAEGKLIANWTIAPGYYLYQNKFKFLLSPDVQNGLGDVNYPKGKTKTDDILGTYQVYDKKLSLELPLQKSIADVKDLKLKITYQGCAEAGLCYPPMKLTVPVNPSQLSLSDTSKNINASSTTNQAETGQANPVEELSEQDQLASILGGGNTLLVLLTFFGLGLALAFTPCVFPMIPILSGIIAGQGDDITTRKAFMMSLLYVLAMAITYTLAGVIAGLSGENIQIWFQNPWVLSVFAGIFVLLALSMFGFYEMQLPSSLQSKITQLSNEQKGGQYSGVIVMGFLSALIVGPCVAPPLMGALIYISQTGDPYLGGAALFFLSMGMGIPLIAIGTSAGKFLPKAGGWMDSVKVFFGIMMLGLAVWMLERVLSPAIIMMLWALILIYSSIYIGALTPITETTTGWGRFRKATGIILLLYGVLLIIGASKGNESLFEPLKDSYVVTSGGGQAQQQAAHAEFETVVTNQALDDTLLKAKNSGQYAMLDYYADWCISCKELEKYTFSDAEVIKTLNNVKLIQADVTVDNDETQQLMKRYKIIGPPAILFFDPSGKELKRFRLVGYKNAEDFKIHLDKVLKR